MKEIDLLTKLSKELDEKIQNTDSKYEVLSPTATFFATSASTVTPDLVIHNIADDSYVILELKHYDHQRPLSLSTAPLVRRLKADNKLRNVRVAIVTNSSISGPLKMELQNEHVPVIAYSDDSQLSDNVWNFLTSKEAHA